MQALLRVSSRVGCVSPPQPGEQARVASPLKKPLPCLTPFEKMLANEGSEVLSVAKLLLAAKERIIERGWCQKSLEDDDHKVCVVGALAVAGASNYFRIERPFRLANGLGYNDSIPKWNDRWWRTKKSVLRAFDRAIAYAERNPT